MTSFWASHAGFTGNVPLGGHGAQLLRGGFRVISRPTASDRPGYTDTHCHSPNN